MTKVWKRCKEKSNLPFDRLNRQREIFPGYLAITKEDRFSIRGSIAIRTVNSYVSTLQVTSYV